MNAHASDELFAGLARWLEAPQTLSAGAVRAAPRSGISFEVGLRRCLGRAELYDRIARRFLETRAAEAHGLQAAFDAGDHETLRRLSHDITSTAGTLGAEGLSATAQALQFAVDAGAGAQDLAPLVHLFVREHAVVLTALAQYARGEVDLQAFAPPASRKT
ncbi:MAG: Hpt domain-containing protein [Rubrivivax sp.]|nr:MAG: Hpt domain-containing protein [Rubrivivax sp.]